MAVLRVLIKIDKTIKDEVNAWIESNIVNAGPNTFFVPYSSDGGVTHTHYVCSWRLDPPLQATLFQYLTQNHNGKWDKKISDSDNAPSDVASWGVVQYGVEQ